MKGRENSRLKRLSHLPDLVQHCYFVALALLKQRPNLLVEFFRENDALDNFVDLPLSVNDYG